MNLEETIIYVYLCVEEKYLEITNTCTLRPRGYAPALSDVEAITIEITGELLGHHQDKAIWQYFDRHWRDWFPRLSAYKTFAKQIANLHDIKRLIFEKLFAPTTDLHIIDGVPLPVCHPARGYRCKIFSQEATWGFCAAKDEYYFGFKGHPVINASDLIVDFTLTSAQVDERDVTMNLINKIRGFLIGDKGYISTEKRTLLAHQDIDLQTPFRDNMTDPRPSSELCALKRIRKKIETAISLLTEKFAFNKIRARSLWHLFAKLYRKLLAYNFYILTKS